MPAGRQGKARQGKARQGKARQGKAGRRKKRKRVKNTSSAEFGFQVSWFCVAFRRVSPRCCLFCWPWK